MKNVAEYIIDKFGGLTPLARLLNCPVSTVQGWKERGRIPQDYWLSIIEAGKKLAIDLSLEDFIDTTPSPKETTEPGEAA